MLSSEEKVERNRNAQALYRVRHLEANRKRQRDYARNLKIVNPAQWQRRNLRSN